MKVKGKMKKFMAWMLTFFMVFSIMPNASLVSQAAPGDAEINAWDCVIKVSNAKSIEAIALMEAAGVTVTIDGVDYGATSGKPKLDEGILAQIHETSAKYEATNCGAAGNLLLDKPELASYVMEYRYEEGGKVLTTSAKVHVRSEWQKQPTSGHWITMGANDLLIPKNVYIKLTTGEAVADDYALLQNYIITRAKAIVFDDGQKVSKDKLSIGNMNEVLQNIQEILDGKKSNATNATLTYFLGDNKATMDIMVAIGSGDFEEGGVELASAKLSTNTPKVGSSIYVAEITDALTKPVVVNTTNADYQWQYFDGVTWKDIPGATESTYKPTNAVKDAYIRCKITGTGDYTGVVYAETADGSTSDGTTDGVGPVQGGTETTPVITAKDFIIGKNETTQPNLSDVVIDRANAKEDNGDKPDVDVSKLKNAPVGTTNVTFKDNDKPAVQPVTVKATVVDSAGDNGGAVVGGNNITLYLSEIQAAAGDDTTIANLIKDRSKAVATNNGVKENDKTKIVVSPADVTNIKGLTTGADTNATLTYNGASATIGVEVIDDMSAAVYPMIDADNVIMSVEDAKAATSDKVRDAAGAVRKTTPTDGDKTPIITAPADVDKLKGVQGPADVTVTLQDTTPGTKGVDSAPDKKIKVNVKDEANKGTGTDDKTVQIGANDITVDLKDIKDLTPDALKALLLDEGNPLALVDGVPGTVTVKDTSIPDDTNNREPGEYEVTFTCDGVDVTVDVSVKDGSVKNPPYVTAGNIIVTLDEIAEGKVNEALVIARSDAKYTDKAGWDGNASGVKVTPAELAKVTSMKNPGEVQITIGNNKGTSAKTQITVTIVDELGSKIPSNNNPGEGIWIGADNITIPASHATNIEENPKATATTDELKKLTNATATNAGKNVPDKDIQVDASKIKGHKGIYELPFKYKSADVAAKVTVTDEGTETATEVICANNFVIGTADRDLLNDDDTVKKLADAVAYDPETLKPIQITGVDKSDIPDGDLEPNKEYKVTFSTDKGTKVTVKVTMDPVWKTIGDPDQASDANQEEGKKTVDQPTAIKNDENYPAIKANDIIMSVDDAKKAKEQDVKDGADAKKLTSPDDKGDATPISVNPTDLDKLNKVEKPQDINVTLKDNTPGDAAPDKVVKVMVKDEANKDTSPIDGKEVSIGADNIEVELADIKNLTPEKVKDLLKKEGHPQALVDGIPRAVTVKDTSIPDNSKDRKPGMYKATFTCDGVDVTVDVWVKPAPTNVTAGDVIVSLSEIAAGIVDEKLILDRADAKYTDENNKPGEVTISKNHIQIINDSEYPQVHTIKVASKDNPDDVKTINVTVVDDLGNLGNHIPEIPYNPGADIWVGANDIAMPYDKVNENKQSPDKIKDLADVAATDAGKYVPKKDIGADPSELQPTKGVYDVTYTYKDTPVKGQVTVTDHGTVDPNGDTICANDFIIGIKDIEKLNDPKIVKKLANVIAYDTTTLKPYDMEDSKVIKVDTSKVPANPEYDKPYDVTFTTPDGTKVTVKVTIDDDWKTIGDVDKASEANKGDTPKNRDEKNGPTTVDQPTAVKNPKKEDDKVIPIDDIKDALGVDEKTAEKIQEVAKELDVPLDTIKITPDVITGQKDDKDMKGSDFGRLKARAVKNKKNQFTLKWTKQKGADGYWIYGNKCNVGKKKYQKKFVADVKKNVTSRVIKEIKKGTYYKYMVVAYKKIDKKTKIAIAASVTVHTTTAGGKKGVAKAVDITKIGNKKVKTKNNSVSYTLKKGKSAKVVASEIREYKNRPISHHRKLLLETSNKKIATVNNDTGKIKAKKKGNCKIWVYAQNGVYSTIKLKVK